MLGAGCLNTQHRPKNQGSVTAFSWDVQIPIPKFRAIIHPDPNHTCRNANILEKKGINSWDGMSRAGDSRLENYTRGQMETISHIARWQQG